MTIGGVGAFHTAQSSPSFAGQDVFDMPALRFNTLGAQVVVVAAADGGRTEQTACLG